MNWLSLLLPSALTKRLSSWELNIPNANWCNSAGDWESSSCPPPHHHHLKNIFFLTTHPQSINVADLLITSDMNSVCQILVPPPLAGCDHYHNYVFSNALMLTDLMNHQMKPFIIGPCTKATFRLSKTSRVTWASNLWVQWMLMMVWTI